MVSAPRFYFQCEGHEPTLLLIKTTQKEVRRAQREPGVLAYAELWGVCSPAASTQASCASGHSAKPALHREVNPAPRLTSPSTQGLPISPGGLGPCRNSLAAYRSIAEMASEPAPGESAVPTSLRPLTAGSQSPVLCSSCHPGST